MASSVCLRVCLRSEAQRENQSVHVFVGRALPCHWYGAHGVVVSHPLRMRKALGSIPSVSNFPCCANPSVLGGLAAWFEVRANQWREKIWRPFCSAGPPALTQPSVLTSLLRSCGQPRLDPQCPIFPAAQIYLCSVARLNTDSSLPEESAGPLWESMVY